MSGSESIFAPGDEARAFAEAMRRDDLDLAGAMLAKLAPAVPGPMLPLAGEYHFRRRQWDVAERYYNRAADLPPADRLKRMFCRNMAAIQVHRPELLAALGRVQSTDPFQIVNTTVGLPTLAQRQGSKLIVLSSTADPRQGLNQSLQQLKSWLQRDGCLGIYGLGDGYLLSVLGRIRPDLPLGMEQCVHVIVPETELLMAALFIHDYGGDDGPLASPRFQFWVGADWAVQLQNAVMADASIPLPQVSIMHGTTGARVESDLAAIGQALAEDLQATRMGNDQLDARRDRAELAALFGPHPPRPPRALIFTSRFTTVLQYSSRDAAEAMGELGWQVTLRMEPSSWQRLTPRGIARAVAEHQPDLVLVIDHLRREYPTLFPANLPYACWIQDQLPNLTNPQAGASIGARDFVLTPVAPMYLGLWGYPARQMIDLPQLTRVPRRPATWTSDGDDLCYVANAWKPIEQIVAETIGAAPNPEVRGLMEECCRRVREVYDRGENLPTLWHMGLLVDGAAGQIGQAPPVNPLRAQVINLLTHPLNNALYRLQALRWVVAVAQRRGLRLALHGRGWERHEEFKDWARGPVEPGEALGEVARRTRINLQIVPSLCLHPRLLDGLVAGGFFLVRRHPADDLLPAVARFLADHADESARTMAELRQRLSGQAARRWDGLLQDAQCLTDLGGPIDLVEWVRCCQRGGLIDAQHRCLPDLDAVSFDDQLSLDSQVQRYLNDEPARRRIAQSQRTGVEERLSYVAGLRSALGRIGRLIEQEA